MNLDGISNQVCLCLGTSSQYLFIREGVECYGLDGLLEGGRMKEPKIPGRTLTVVIRDDSPMIHCGDSPAYRSVQLELTDEQLARIGLKWTYSSGSIDYYEEISRCFIEPPSA